MPPQDKIVYVHYVAKDPDGPIRQSRKSASQEVGGQKIEAVFCSGSNLRVPCQPRRAYLNRGVGKGKAFRLTEFFPATSQLYVERRGADGKAVRIELVTCPRCRASALYKRDVEAYERSAAQGV